jgi:hypothetical protein
MSECEYIQGCPMFKKFKLEPIKNFWIDQYCKRDGGGDCSRKSLRKQGKGPEEVPENLLPNGEYMMR